MSRTKNKPKIIVVLGTTASGKTSLGVKLAAKYNGEIISADSRQVFKGMDIGTGKDLAEYQVGRKKIPYHLIDVVSPNTEFNLANYQKLTKDAIADILSRGKLPIIVGGTGLYLQAIIDGYKLTKGVPDPKRRAELDAMTASELLKIVEKMNAEFAHHLNNSDKHNPRRLIRYIEIMEQGGSTKPVKRQDKYNFLLLGLSWPDDVLRERIMARLMSRLDKENMVGEIENLQADGVSWQRLNSFGLEYRFIAYYLQGKLEYDEMIEKLGIAIYRFAKRQKTWFKRWEKQGRKIEWIKDLKEAEKLVDKFL
jgi:tRNA dimethylallyltransferase